MSRMVYSVTSYAQGSAVNGIPTHTHTLTMTIHSPFPCSSSLGPLVVDHSHNYHNDDNRHSDTEC